MDTTTKAEMIAANVRRAVAASRMTKVAVAKAADIPYGTLKAHMGGRGQFTGTDILALCEVLDVDPSELLAVKTVVAS